MGFGTNGSLLFHVLLPKWQSYTSWTSTSFWSQTLWMLRWYIFDVDIEAAVFTSSYAVLSTKNRIVRSLGFAAAHRACLWLRDEELIFMWCLLPFTKPLCGTSTRWSLMCIGVVNDRKIGMNIQGLRNSQEQCPWHFQSRCETPTSFELFLWRPKTVPNTRRGLNGDMPDSKEGWLLHLDEFVKAGKAFTIMFRIGGHYADSDSVTLSSTRMQGVWGLVDQGGYHLEDSLEEHKWCCQVLAQNWPFSTFFPKVCLLSGLYSDLLITSKTRGWMVLWKEGSEVMEPIALPAFQFHVGQEVEISQSCKQDSDGWVHAQVCICSEFTANYCWHTRLILLVNSCHSQL